LPPALYNFIGNNTLKRINTLLSISTLIIVTSFIGCETGVENSPTPGTLRVYLQTNSFDTYFVDKGDTFSVFTPYETVFNLNVFQGSIYSKGNFAILFKTIDSYRQTDQYYNFLAPTFNKGPVQNLVLKLQTGDTTLAEIQPPELAKFCEDIINVENGSVDIKQLSVPYQQYKVFESYVPPGDYDTLKFGLNAVKDVFANRVVIVSKSGKEFVVPLELPPNESLLLSFPIDAKVREGAVTEIYLEIFPFESIYRYRDSYRLKREISVFKVINPQ